MKKARIIFVLLAFFALGAVAFAHISSQRANCRLCSCTYFSHDEDIAGSCYCTCGHSWKAHD